MSRSELPHSTIVTAVIAVYDEHVANLGNGMEPAFSYRTVRFGLTEIQLETMRLVKGEYVANLVLESNDGKPIEKDDR